MAANNVREIILDILLSVFRDGVYSHNAIHGALEKVQYFSKRDRAFITKVCEGTVERLIELDYIIDKFSSVPVTKMKPVIQNILRSATYQICFMGGVPNSAAINEAVKIAQARWFYGLKAFVNGILRNIDRNASEIEYPSKKSDPVRYYSVRYSMPEWIVEAWLMEFGEFVTVRMLESFLKERPTTVRLKLHAANKKEILASLRSQGVTVSRAPYVNYAYNIAGYNYLPALDAFMKGWIFPQDVSSMLVGECARPNPGDYVIDMCAAPGGKCLHVADMMGGFGMVDARDVSQDKVSLIQENVRRADLINVRASVMDALTFDGASEGRADLVICDVPCSGLGVIGRKPDIKYRITPAKIGELVELQRRILHNAASYVKPGGTLMYSTCTISREENQENVRWFVDNYPFHTESLNPYLPREIWRNSTEEGYLQLMPGIHETDGFFLCRMRRDPE